MGNRIDFSSVDLSGCNSVLIQTRDITRQKTNLAIEKLQEMGIGNITVISTGVNPNIKEKIKNGEFHAILLLTARGKIVPHKKLRNLIA